MKLTWSYGNQKSNSWLRAVWTIWFILLIVGFTFAWLRYHWSTIYAGNEVTVRYRNLGSYLLIRVKAPSNISPSFRFDYWQDGLSHRSDMLRPGNKVEPNYAVEEDGAICAQYGIFDVSAEKYGSSICGGLVSSAKLIDFTRGPTHWEYTIVLPKQELSSSNDSASVVIDLRNETAERVDSYPPARFKAPAHIQFMKDPFDFRGFLH